MTILATKDNNKNGYEKLSVSIDCDDIPTSMATKQKDIIDGDEDIRVSIDCDDVMNGDEDVQLPADRNAIPASGGVLAQAAARQEKAPRYLTLSREELESLMDARAKRERDELKQEFEDLMRQERNERMALEAKVGTLLNPGFSTVSNNTSTQQSPSSQRPKQESADAWHAPFGESVYTLLYMSGRHSPGFFYALFIYTLQIATVTLTLADVADENIPPMVDLTVTCTQAITIFILLPYMSDVIEGMLKLQDGYYPELRATHPGATYSHWLIACLAQLGAGLLVLVTSVILTLQVKTVIECMLNLTALLFISEMDDLGFYMAKMGFITDGIQAEAMAVIDVQVPKRQRRNTQRRTLYVLALVGLMAGYGVVKKRQLDGYYLPTYIYVQFGDAYDTKIAYYSGIMTSGHDSTPLHRQYRDMKTQTILLSYCNEENAWTFSDRDDPCDYFATSSNTLTYDVTTIPDSAWKVRDSIGRLQPFDSFSLANRDCNPHTCQGVCDSEGLCQCPHDRFGLDCGFSDPCTDLALDSRFPQFPPVRINGDLYETSDNFRLLQNTDTNEYVKVSNMPVYYSNKTYPANVIFFGGRRCIFTTEDDLIDLEQARMQNPLIQFFPQRTAAVLENKFHGHHLANYTPCFMSDPVDYETPEFSATPTGLEWWSVQEGNSTKRDYSPDILLYTVLVCPGSNTCLGQPEGYCVNGLCDATTGSCVCNKDGFFGAKCDQQIACYDQDWQCQGRGLCDESSGFCRCSDPYFGKVCENVRRCYETGGECKNGGVCNSVTGDCGCPDPATSGAACEYIADCTVYGCVNGGVCTLNGQCVCRTPFHGVHCHLVDTNQTEFLCSIDEDCMNGICDGATGTCTCQDPTTYGTLCEHRYNCSEVSRLQPGCLNSGTCDSDTGLCLCIEPFFGPECGRSPPCLSDKECGDGTCDTASGLCECDAGNRGTRCDMPAYCGLEYLDECNYRGTCDGIRGVCDCSPGITGKSCHLFVSDETDPEFDEDNTKRTRNVTCCGFDDPDCWGCYGFDAPLCCDDL